MQIKPVSTPALSTLGATAGTAASAPASTTAPATATAPESQPASDPLDFCSLDRPEKALVLPGLNLLNTMVMNGMFTATAMSGYPLQGGLSMAIRNADRQVDLNAQYKVLANDPTPGSMLGIQAEGTLGGARFHETWSMCMDDSVKVTGGVEGGGRQSSWELVMSGSGITGNVGGMPVSLKGSLMNGLNGQIGNEAIHEPVKLDNAGGTALYNIASNDTLADHAFSFSGKAEHAENSKGIVSNGAGQVGAYNFTIHQDIAPIVPPTPANA